MRFCTEYMKIIPMFEYIYKYLETPVQMNIGFRYDENHRAGIDETIKFPISCGYSKSNQGRQKWKHDYKYRELLYPMIEDKIMHPHVDNYWKENTDIVFPKNTGCQICFHKPPMQIKLNSERNLETGAIVKWSNVFEHIMGHRFKKDISMQQIFEIGIQLDFFDGVGPECQAGICGI